MFANVSFLCVCKKIPTNISVWFGINLLILLWVKITVLGSCRQTPRPWSSVVKKQSRTKASSGAKTRRRSNKQNKPGAISSLGLSGGRSITNDSSLPRRRVTFEFGFASRSKGNRSQVSRPSVSADNSRSTNDLRAKLQERKDSSVLFVSDTRVMVPMQLLDKARKKLGQDEEWFSGWSLWCAISVLH